MRAFVFLFFLSIASAAEAIPAPRRVASLNLCTDELVLALADPRQIVSVTHLSQDPAESVLAARARRYRPNDGSLLSVVPVRPDLVLTMGGGARDRVGLADRLSLRMIDLPYPQSLADVVRSVRIIARALGRPSAGRRVIGRIERLVSGAPRTRRDAIWLGGGGRSVAPDSLASRWMALAGLRQRPLAGDRVSLETLLVSPPAILLRSDYRSHQFSRLERWLSHPAARRLREGRIVRTDGRVWTCLGPALIDEILRLRTVAAP